MPAKQITVLIVEDDALIRLALADQLRGQGYRTIEASDAMEAIDLLEHTNQVTAVFTDIELAGSMNGLLLARYVSKWWPDIRIIVRSGRSEATSDQMPPGAIFLPKPCRMMDMQRAYALIDRALSSSIIETQ